MVGVRNQVRRSFKQKGWRQTSVREQAGEEVGAVAVPPDVLEALPVNHPRRRQAINSEPYRLKNFLLKG